MSEPAKPDACDDGASYVQAAWQDLAADLRRALHAKIGMVPKMSADEVKDLVGAIDLAQEIEVAAAIHDKRIDLELGRLSAD